MLTCVDLVYPYLVHKTSKDKLSISQGTLRPVRKRDKGGQERGCGRRDLLAKWARRSQWWLVLL